MGLEIRNINPPNSGSYVPITSNIFFNVVGLDGSMVDISTLSVEIETTSLIDSTEASITVTTASSDATIHYTGNSLAYAVSINPPLPFEYGQSVTVKIDVDDTLGTAMDQYSISFTTINNGLISVFRCAYINQADRIPVYNERLRPWDATADPTTFMSAYQAWNSFPAPIIEVNKVQVTSGYTIDYENGRVIFDSAKEANDEIKATYTFRLFSDEQILAFIDQATSIYRIHPPFGGPTSVFQASKYLQDIMMVGAASFAFRDLMFQLAFQERAIIFDDLSWKEWGRAKDQFKSLADAWAQLWKDVLEAKKAQLPTIASVVTPEFTLPGGRSRFFRYLYKGGGGTT